MKKIMLIAVVSLLIAGNAFGQAADWEVKPMVKKPKPAVRKPFVTSKIKKPISVKGGIHADTDDTDLIFGKSGGTVSNQRARIRSGRMTQTKIVARSKRPSRKGEINTSGGECFNQRKIADTFGKGFIKCSGNG